MAKPLNENDRINYTIERISTKMSREELNELYEQFSSDDDYVNFHIDNIEDTHNKYYITILNDEKESPIKDSGEDRSYGFMRVKDALEFVNEYIDEGRCNSKTKAVMQQGYSKKSLDKYNDLVEQEEEESEVVNEFTKPSFEEVMNNIYMNDYRGSIYNEPDEYLPDELREDVGVIIPGIIDTREEYFEFVKRLKDRGKNGLGRSIYPKYEEYEEAVDLIEQYKQALYDKYGGKEEFFYAKQLGGMFGAYEYYPEIKPRFKRTQRNIKLSKGINLNELALVEDMGRRIREEYEEEINNIELDEEEVIVYENTPPKFKDLPEELKMFYTTDKYGINGFTHTDRFKSLREYANEMTKSKDPEKQYEGYKILDELEREEIYYREQYSSEFVTVSDLDDLNDESIISQLEYDRIMYETNNDSYYADSVVDVTPEFLAYKTFVKNQLLASDDELDEKDPMDKTRIGDITDHAARYVFDDVYKKKVDEQSKVNSAGDVLYRNNKEVSFENGKKAKVKSNESKVKHYVSEVVKETKRTIDNSNSNADIVHGRNTTTTLIDQHDICSIDGRGKFGDITSTFSIESTPKDMVKYMKNNETLAKRVYEVGSDNNVGDLFSERTNIDDFVNEISKSTKPMMTEDMIEKSMKNNRKVVR
jgi:hypothetical protein